jgi:hypothetical protein
MANRKKLRGFYEFTFYSHIKVSMRIITIKYLKTKKFKLNYNGSRQIIYA